MRPAYNRARVKVEESPGRLRITVRANVTPYGVLFAVGIPLILVSVLVHSWTATPTLLRVLLLGVLIVGVPAMIYRFSGTETIGFDSRNLTITKEFHAWKRTREYRLQACTGLKWEPGDENHQTGLECKVGEKTVTVAYYISEHDARSALAALQRSLPDVAERICADPAAIRIS